MSFKDCIDSALLVGQISGSKADKAKAAHEAEFERVKLEGMDESAAELAASRAATKEISEANSNRRWQKMKDIQAAHTITQRLTKAKDPVQELEAVMAGVEYDYMFVQSVALSYIDHLMMKYKPTVRNSTPEKGQDEIIDAFYGKSSSAEAQADAKAITDMYEMLRKWANRHGASIPATKKGHLPQTHDGAKVSRVQEYTRADGSRSNTWVDDHLQEGIIDWETMRLEGKLFQ